MDSDSNKLNDEEEATVGEGRTCRMCQKPLKNGEWYCHDCKIKKDKIRISGAEQKGMGFPERNGLVIRKKTNEL